MANILTLLGKRRKSLLVLPGTPLAIYSVVKTPAWTGNCLRVQRSSDSTQLDIGFGKDGFVDMVAALAFAAGSNLTVATWYDQSGNGYDATATTTKPALRLENKISGKQPVSFVDSTGSGSSKLTIPPGLTVSTQNFSVAMAYASGGGLLNFNSLLGIGTQINIWWEKYAGVLQGSSTFAGGDKKKFTPRAGQVDSFILSGDASGKYMRLNGNDQSHTAYSGATTSGAYIGGSTVVAASSIEIFAYVVYGSALSAGDKNSIEAAFATTFKSNLPRTSKIIYDGDSITAGFTTGSYLYGWPRVVSSILGQTLSVVNVAVPGSTINTCYTQRAQVTGRYDSAFAKNVSVIFAGTNDIEGRASGTIAGYGTTVFNTYTLPYIQAMQAAGFTKVLAATAIARTFTGSSTDKSEKETERLAYNQLIRDNAVANNYVVLDFAGLSQMSDSTNATYFIDTVHPTRAGYNIMGTYAEPIIGAWI
jgi:lysophospholipase L1-like esterase